MKGNEADWLKRTKGEGQVIFSFLVLRGFKNKIHMYFSIKTFGKSVLEVDSKTLIPLFIRINTMFKRLYDLSLRKQIPVTG